MIVKRYKPFSKMKTINISTVTVLILLISCNTVKLGKKDKFEHSLFSIEYPKSWTKLDNDIFVLSIIKYDEERGDNVSLDVSVVDSALIAAEQEINLRDLAEGMKGFLLSTPNYVLVKDLKPVSLYGNNALTMSLDENFNHHKKSEKYYYLYHAGYYLTFILKSVDDHDTDELEQISKTLWFN